MYTKEFLENRFGSSKGVKNWYFYSYEYLDDLSFMPLAKEIFRDWEEGEKILNEVKKKFKKIGWDGDGEIQVMWFPPFVGAGPDNNFGCYAIHVKQLNDGISFIASAYALPFHRLFQSDDSNFLPAGASTLDSIHYRRGSIEYTNKFLGYLESDLKDENS